MSEETKKTAEAPEQEAKETEAAPQEAPETAAAPEKEAEAEPADAKKKDGWFNKKAREMDAVKAKLDAAEKNAAQAKDQLLRMAAEYENYRKRSTREADQKFNDGVSFAVNQIIPILDTLEMAANAPRKGQDIRVRITLTFDEAVHGCKKNITITRQQECTECHGSGCAAGSSPETCPDCGGRGFVIRQQRTPFGVMQTQQPCSRCGGKGKLIKNPCKSCHGSGTLAVKKTLEANVPAGIDDDQGFRLSGMGNAGTNGGPAGDVIVAVTVQPSEVFQRDENNIYVVFPITYSQAVLGDTITVPSIDGKVEVNVPEGTQSGTTFRLRGKGIQYVNGRGRGDMYVKCEVEIPKKLSRTQREALKKFEGTLKEDNYEKRKGFFKKLKDMFNN